MAQTVGTGRTSNSGGADSETERAPQRVLADRASAAVGDSHRRDDIARDPSPTSAAVSDHCGSASTRSSGREISHFTPCGAYWRSTLPPNPNVSSSRMRAVP
jgi:hypothetical protein